jgi:3-isopropylmalate dehydrogenase
MCLDLIDPDMSATDIATTFQIAVLPGDGIGEDVTQAGARVLRALERGLDDVTFDLHLFPAGAGEFLRSGTALPDHTFEACQNSHAILLGAMGLPDVRYPDGKELTPQIDIRERLQLYSGLRPTHLYHENDCPLKGYQAGEIDFVIVRESTEGLFSARLSQGDGSGDEVRDVLRITRKGSERVCRAAFELARTRRKKVTLVDKANVLPSMVFFRKIFDEVATDFPDVEAEHCYVDAAALFLVRRPESFDVMVTENMFGDILSDLASGLIGGMGMAPSADIGDETAVFQPAHGTAPDIAGKGIANPVAMILSVAMMLDWLPGQNGQPVRTAVSRALANPENRTPDAGGKLTTTQMTDAILKELEA